MSDKKHEPMKHLQGILEMQIRVQEVFAPYVRAALEVQRSLAPYADGAAAEYARAHEAMRPAVEVAATEIARACEALRPSLEVAGDALKGFLTPEFLQIAGWAIEAREAADRAAAALPDSVAYDHAEIFRKDPAPAERPAFASTMFGALLERLKKFQERLADGEELAITDINGKMLVRVEKISCQDPHMVIIEGWSVPGGHRAEVVQHLSQLNILLEALPALDGKKGRRVGFEPPGPKA